MLLAARRLSAAAVVMATLGSGPSHAFAEGAPRGLGCVFEASVDATMSRWTGFLWGGPVAAPGAEVTLTCTLRDGYGGFADPVLVSESSAPSPGVAVVEPRPFDVAVDTNPHVCTEVTVGTTTWYLSADASGDTAWTTAPGSYCGSTPGEVLTGSPEVVRLLVDTVYCWVVLQVACPLVDPLVENLNDLVFEPYVDPLVCPVFAALSPGVPGVVDIDPEGDVTVVDTGKWWDCPPYDDAG